MISLRVYVKICGLMLITCLILLSGVQARENGQVEVNIIEPELGQQVSGSIKIEAQGGGFKFCDRAKFSYSTDQESYESIGIVRAKTSAQVYECKFQASWDTTNLPSGKYYLKVVIWGYKGKQNLSAKASDEIYVEVVGPKKPEAEIAQPQEKTSLDRQPIQIEAKGYRFDSCFTADFEYKTEGEGYQEIARGIEPQSDCTFSTSWDITDLKKYPEGTYQLKATIKGRKGGEKIQASDEIEVYIGPTPSPLPTLKADFEWSPKKPTAQDRVLFIDKSQPGEKIVGWEWEFGDGATSIDRNPKHQYEEDGEYEVTLTVTTKVGDKASKTKSITIKPFKKISASRSINAFPSLGEKGTSSPSVLPGNIFGVTVTIKVNSDILALSLNENLNGKDGLPEGWQLKEPRTAGTVVNTEFRESTLEWIFQGSKSNPIQEGTTITVKYRLRVPEKPIPGNQIKITGEVNTPSKAWKVEASQIKVVKKLPLKVVIAHIKGKDCTASSPKKCEVDPSDDDLISQNQLNIAKDFWRYIDDEGNQIGIPYTSPKPEKREKISSSDLLELEYYYYNQVPITKEFEVPPIVYTKEAISANRAVEAFPALSPTESPKVLPGTKFKVTVDIEVNRDVIAVSLNEDVDGRDGLPESWEFTRDPPEFSNGVINLEFRESTLEWIFQGSKSNPIRKGNTIKVTYYLKSPKGPRAILSEKAKVLRGKIMGSHKITGEVVNVNGEINRVHIPLSQFTMVKKLPLKVVIAHIKEGCKASSPKKCEVDPLDDDLISQNQLNIAKDFWRNNLPVPYATEPAKITTPTLLELECYSKNEIPVTEPTCKVTTEKAFRGSASRIIRGYSSTSSEPPFQVPKGASFQVSVSINLETNATLLKLHEAFPNGWSVKDWNVKAQPQSVKPYCEYNESIKEWICRGSLPAGVELTITYLLEVPETETKGIYTINGEISSERSSAIPVTGNTDVEVVNLLPIKVVLAHIVGKECGPTSPEKCELDPLSDDFISKNQFKIAKEFYESEVAAPFSKPSKITSQILNELECYYEKGVLVTNPTCTPSEEGSRLQGSATRTISTFPPIPPDTLPQVLPGNLLEVIIEIQVKSDINTLYLDEDLPEDWIVTNYSSPKIQPPTSQIEYDYNSSLSKWVFRGKIPSGTTLRITYQLQVPKTTLLIIGKVYEIMGNISAGKALGFQVSGDSEVQVVEALPIKMVIAHLGGKDCNLESLEKCKVDPTLDNLVNSQQLEIAKLLWQKDIPVSKAFGPNGEQPAYITYKLLQKLICYHQNQVPITKNCP